MEKFRALAVGHRKIPSIPARRLGGLQIHTFLIDIEVPNNNIINIVRHKIEKYADLVNEAE